MKLINRENGEELVEVGSHKDYASNVKQTIQSESLWNKIDNEIKNLNDDQRNILFSDKNYISIDTQLKILVQEALVNSVKNVIENSEIGNKLLTQQLNLIKTNNIGKVNQALSIIADENGMIDADGILNDMIDNLIISPVKEERGIKIGAGNVEIKIPFINKAIALDKDDINEFKEMLSKIQQ